MSVRCTAIISIKTGDMYNRHKNIKKTLKAFLNFPVSLIELSDLSGWSCDCEYFWNSIQFNCQTYLGGLTDKLQQLRARPDRRGRWDKLRENCVFSNRLPERRHNHIGCIYLAFLHCKKCVCQRARWIAMATTSWLPNQMISLILIFGFLCRSSIFQYPDDQEI